MIWLLWCNLQALSQHCAVTLPVQGGFQMGVSCFIVFTLHSLDARFDMALCVAPQRAYMSDAAPELHSVSIFKQAMCHALSVVHGFEQAIQQERQTVERCGPWLQQA